ncbi:MAG: hypothetical protein ACXW3T_14990 [Rhodoplanes sp.]
MQAEWFESRRPARAPGLPIFIDDHDIEGVMDRQEKMLIEALVKVDTFGDIAPAHVQDPMTMVLRQRALFADLMRWDDYRGGYILTGTGRRRIAARYRAQSSVIHFTTRAKRSDKPKKA